MRSAGCPYCKCIGFHLVQCPEYEQGRAKKYCTYCGEGIYSGEKYLENDWGESIHKDCIMSVDDLIDWLGLGYKEMEEDNV